MPLMPLRGKLVCTACCRLVNYYNCEVPAIFRLALVHQRYMPTYRPADTAPQPGGSQIHITELGHFVIFLLLLDP